MRIRQKIDNLLKLEGKDYAYLADRLDMKKDDLIPLLDRTDLMPSFVNKLADMLHTTSKDLLDDTTDSIPWFVYDSTTKDIKKKTYKTIFQASYWYFLTCLGIEMILLNLMGTTDSAMKLVLLVCGIALLVYSVIIMPLSYLYDLPEYLCENMRIALYERGVDFYSLKDGQPDLVKRELGKDAIVCYETKEFFILDYPYSFNKSVCIPKNGLPCEAMEKLRSLLTSQSALMTVKEKIPFEHFNRMDTYEKAKKRNRTYAILKWTFALILFIAMIFGFGFMFMNVIIIEPLFAFLFATMLSAILFGIYYLISR